MSKLKLLRPQGWQVSSHDNHCQVNCGFGFPIPIKTKQQQMKHDVICIILVKEQCCGERGAVLKGMTHKLFGRLWLEDTLGERVYIHVDTELRSCSNLRPHALYQPLWSGMISCAKFLWQMPKPFLLNWPTNSWFWLLSLGNTPTLILARNLCCMSSCSCFLIIPSVTVASRFQCGENICEFKKKTNKKTPDLLH